MIDWRQQVHAAAAAYGTNPKLLDAINQREQSGTSNFVINDWDSNAAAGIPSGGPFQFIKPTFDAYARQARKANPAAWRGVELEWRNPYAQALAASWAIRNGKGKAWATFGDALQDAGGQLRGVQRTPTAATPGGASTLATPSVGMDPRKAAAVTTVFGRGSNPRMRALLERAIAQQSTSASNATGASSSPTGAVDSTPVGPVGAGPGSSWKSLRDWTVKYAGADVQGDFQTTGGRHNPDGNHPKGLAIDLGDATVKRAQFNRIAAFAKKHPHLFTELYFNPLGWGIKNGKVIKGLTVAGHDDHMHLAVPGGRR